MDNKKRLRNMVCKFQANLDQQLEELTTAFESMTENEHAALREYLDCCAKPTEPPLLRIAAAYAIYGHQVVFMHSVKRSGHGDTATP